MDNLQQHVVEQSATALKAKISAGTGSGGIITIILSSLAENQEAIQSIGVLVGIVCTVIGTFFTVYYLRKNHHLRKDELISRLREEIKNQ